MSFLPLEQQENQQGGQTSTAGGTTGGATPPETPSSGGSAGAEAAGGTAKTSAGGTPTQFGSSASKLGDYLRANAPQVGAQAANISGKLNTQYGQLQQGIQEAANQFGQQIQKGYTANRPELVNQAIANPTQFAMNPENVKAFQQQYNNQYTGPQNFTETQGYGDLQSQVQAAQKQADLLKTQPGLQSYLQGRGNNPTPASSTLDALLLKGNPGAQQTIQNAATQFGGLGGQLGSATEQANKAVADAQQAALQSQTYAKSQFDPFVQGFGEQINQNVNTAQKKANKFNQQLDSIQQKLNTGAALTTDEAQLIDPSGILETLNPYGMSTGVYGNALKMGLPGVSPSGMAYYYTGAPGSLGPVSAENVMTPEQAAEAQALNQLSGNGTLPTASGQQFAVPTSMGKFNGPQALTDLYNQLNSYTNQIPTGTYKSTPEHGAKLFGSTAGYAYGPAGSMLGGSLGSVIDQLQSNKNKTPDSTSVFENLTPDQQKAWLHYMQTLQGYLGMPNPGNIQPIQPPPSNPLPPGVKLQPETPPPTTGTGRRAY